MEIGIRFTFTVKKISPKQYVNEITVNLKSQPVIKIAIIISLCLWRESWKRTKVNRDSGIQILGGMYEYIYTSTDICYPQNTNINDLLLSSPIGVQTVNVSEGNINIKQEINISRWM